jgi:hypothetical protein
MENKIHALVDWIPYKLVDKGGLLFFEWIYLGDKRFEEPFFDDTIAQCRSHVFNSSRYKVLSTADNLIEWCDQLVTVPLSGLLFHVSRCGSTMISQLLAVSSSNIVISEAPVIDQILRNERLDILTKKNLICAVLNFFGQQRFQEEQHLILKLDAWHLLEIGQLRLFFPNLPFVILYRNPAAVLKSHINLRGMHMVPEMLPLRMFGLGDSTNTVLSLNQFGVVVLEKYYEAILNFISGNDNIMVADYSEGMESIIIRFNIFLNIYVSKETHNNIQQRLKAHSKYPESVFTEDKEPLLKNDLTIVNNLYNQINIFSMRIETN